MLIVKVRDYVPSKFKKTILSEVFSLKACLSSQEPSFSIIFTS